MERDSRQVIKSKQMERLVMLLSDKIKQDPKVWEQVRLIRDCSLAQLKAIETLITLFMPQDEETKD